MMSESLLFFMVNFLLAANPATILHEPFPYDLDQPNAIFEMPESLKEISGLSMTADYNSLAAVNDEEGIVFILDKMNGAITREIQFWNEGDYEGIEIVGDDAYVIKSSGTIYQLKNYESDSLQLYKIKSFLNKENDVEGLALDPDRNSLLVGCKGKAMEGEEEGLALKKAIYQFSLSDMVMKNEPVFMLTLPDVQEYVSHLEEGHEGLAKLREDFSGNPERMKFSPSGIAIHPISKNVYVTSSKGKLLLVLSPEGKILHLQKLKKKIHVQPEGICFDKDGTLYIANEGKEDKAKVYKFLALE